MKTVTPEASEIVGLPGTVLRTSGGQVVPFAEDLDAGAFSSAAWRALQRAGAHAANGWNEATATAASIPDVHAPMRALCGAVRDAASGERQTMLGIPGTVPARRLLEALRAAFLAQVQVPSEDLPPTDALRVLAAMEQVQRALDDDAAHRFAYRLSGADALELLVEVAHDMRSPLGSILFLAERLRKSQSGPVNAIQERQLGLVYSAAFGLSSLASDVMELARGGERLIDRQPTAFSISDIMRSVQEIVQPIAEEKGLEIHITTPPSDFRVGQPAALNRVLLNLVTNALKFTAKGQVEVEVTQHGRSKLHFAVSDTGRGIPPQVLATLFEAFRRRAKPGEYFFSSAGLGLSICQKLVQMMGGELQVETEIEKGTRFWFELECPPAQKI